MKPKRAWLLSLSGRVANPPIRAILHPMQARPRWEERADHTRTVIAAALEAVAPQRAVLRHLSREGEWLRAGARDYHLPDFRRVLLLGFGKAAVAMAQAADTVLGERLTGGTIVTNHGHRVNLRNVEIVEAGHPLPDDSSIAGAERILASVGTPGEDDLIIVLISGGGSTLFTLPTPGISLAELQWMNERLLRSGADIHQLNTVRKHLSQVKGGNLARRLYPARVVALLLSDVVGNDESVIASGPLSPDGSTFAQAWETLGQFGLRGDLPQSVRARLRRGMHAELDENPIAGDRAFERVQSLLVGDNEEAARGAVKQAIELGFSARLLTPSLGGMARKAGRWIVQQAREARAYGAVGKPICLVAGGETTVKVRGDGKGGRNQELVLAAALEMDPEKDERARLVCLATDGQDGPTDSAGAVAEADSLARGVAAGLDARAHLRNNDSYSYFSALDDLIITGPTGTNVSDLLFWFWY